MKSGRFDVYILYHEVDSIIVDAVQKILSKRGLLVQSWGEQANERSTESSVRDGVDSSDCTIIFWSKVSFKQDSIYAEAYGAKMQHKLISVALRDVEVPEKFSDVKSLDLGEFDGKQFSKFDNLLSSVNSLVSVSSTQTGCNLDAKGEERLVRLPYLEVLRIRNANGDNTICSESPFEWPGWAIPDNEHGAHFDLAARERMVEGSEALLHYPFIEKYLDEMGSVLLEVGPFFNPIAVRERFPDKNFFYWENDDSVLEWLNQRSGDGYYPVRCQLNGLGGKGSLGLRRATKGQFKALERKLGRKIPHLFDCVIASHVFNYIDYRQFLIFVREFMGEGSILFVNNVVDYGLPMFFSSERPRTIEETIATLEELGFQIIEKELHSVERSMGQERLLVASRLCK